MIVINVVKYEEICCLLLLGFSKLKNWFQLQICKIQKRNNTFYPRINVFMTTDYVEILKY